MHIDPTRLEKITTGGIEKVTSAKVEATEAAEAQAAAAPAQADRLVLSQQAAAVQAAHEALAQTPEVRAELVAKLKGQVEAGTYKVDADKIAEKMAP